MANFSLKVYLKQKKYVFAIPIYRAKQPPCIK